MVAAVAVLLGTKSQADTVTMKDGKAHKGNVILQTDDEVWLKTPEGKTLRLKRTGIKKIEQDTPPKASKFSYYVVPVKGVIGKDLTSKLMETYLHQAKRFSPSVVVLEVDTPGGNTAEAGKILSLMIKSKDLRFVALVREAGSASIAITLACRDIYMIKGAKIGAATPYSVNRRGQPVVLPKDIAEKFQSWWRATCRTAAQHGGHSPLIAEAMIDRDFALTMRIKDGQKVFERDGRGKILKPRGKVLTLTAEEAVDWGLAKGFVDDYADLGRQLSMKGWRPVGTTAVRIAAARAEYLIRTLPEGHPDRVILEKKQQEIRLQAVENLRKAIPDAERAYSQALKEWPDASQALKKAYKDLRDPRVSNKPQLAELQKLKAAEGKKGQAYVKYVIASQKYIRGLVKSAEAWKKHSTGQKALGEKIVNVVEGWTKHQGKQMYDAPPEGVQMWMNLHLGRGYVFAGKVDEGVKKGFKKVLDIAPERFPKSAQPWAWRVRLTSMMFMAMALYDKAEKTGAREDYEAARRAIGPEFGRHASGNVLGIRAMILRGQVLGKLKQRKQAIGELNRALVKIRALAARGNKDPESKYAPDLRSRALEALAKLSKE